GQIIPLRKIETQHNKLKKEHEGCEPRTSQALEGAEAEKALLCHRAEGAEAKVADLEAEVRSLRDQAAESSDAEQKKVADLQAEVKTLQGQVKTRESDPVDMLEKFQEVVESLETANAELKANADEAAKTSNKAWQPSVKAFQGFHILPAASTRFQCGFYAIIESIKGLNYVDKNRQLPVPSPSELEDALHLGWIISTGGPRVTEGPAVTAAGLDGWVSPDEASMALNQWATKYDFKFQIGYITELGSSEGKTPLPDKHQGSSRPSLLFSPHEDDPERILVWLHHNGNDPCGHYSVMRSHIPPPSKKVEKK
ncbi:MAG: hypothetical protein Q9226_004866, partial [Calogaya cf. arnoldii]